jgi:hypothetical protein
MLLKKTIKITFLFLFLIAFASIGKAIAQPVVQEVRIDPLNRAALYFSIIPEKYSLELSEDKLKITLAIDDARVIDSVKHRAGKGIIHDVYVNQKENNLEVLFLVKGYTRLHNSQTRLLQIDST